MCECQGWDFSPHVLFTRLPSLTPNSTKPLNQRLHSPNVSTSAAISQGGISIWSEMAKEKKLQWNIQHIHIWLLLREGSGGWVGEVLGVVRCLTPLKPITSAYFLLHRFRGLCFCENRKWPKLRIIWLLVVLKLKKKKKFSSSSMQSYQLEIKFVESQAYQTIK